MAIHRRRCRRRKELLAESQWPVGNRNVPEVQDMLEGDIKHGVRALLSIEQAVRCRYEDSHGPLTLRLGMTAMVGGTTKVHYILNRLGLVPSYDTIYRIRKKICNEVASHPRGTMRDLPRHVVAIFAVDNLDQTNQHGLTIKGQTVHGLHITAIKAVLQNVNMPIPREIPVCRPNDRRHEKITDANEFVRGFIPGEDDPDINTYVAMFIGAVYRHQHRIATDDPRNAMYISNLLLSLFEEFRNNNETPYADVIDENAGNKSEIHKSI